MDKIQGVVLYRGLSKINHTPIVAIATNIAIPSKNIKTGKVIQVYILDACESPLSAALSGNDTSICGNCPHKFTNNNTCYVNPAKGIGHIYRADLRDKYPEYDKALHLSLFKGRKIRFGAYGEPVLIPANIVRDIVNVAKSHTGYTHLWKGYHGKPYKGLFMASVDNICEAALSVSKGWKYFRVVPIGGDTYEHEKICLNESVGIQCDICMKCNGSKNNIVITAHGRRAKHIS